MTMADLANGPQWVGYAGAAVLLICSVILLLGHGSWMISGYNTAPPKEREKYDERRLCRVMGGGLGIIGVLVLVTCLWEEQLPSWFVYVMIAVVLIDILVVIILSYTVCKKS